MSYGITISTELITYVNKRLKAEASSVSPPWKQMEELWVVRVFM